MNYFEPQARRRLQLRRGKERLIASRHPWIFEGAISRESGPASAALADLVDDEGRPVASGFYSAASQIRLRVVARDEELTETLLGKRLDEAFGKREELRDTNTNSMRLVHSEGDLLSGLVIDRYGDYVVVEITSAGLELLRPLVVRLITERLAPRAIVFRNNLPSRKLEKLPLIDEVVQGELSDTVEIRESGLTFDVALLEGQKTGFFLDQRENRRKLQHLARQASVLNLFSYSGAFGVYAAAGGASRVEEVDISAPAMEMARRNHALNPAAASVSFVVADAFSDVRRRSVAGERFDIVVCDPPAFARTRGDVDRAARGYKDINLQAMKLVRPGGYLMTFSCSGHISTDLFQKIIYSAAMDVKVEAAIVERLGAGSDHPVSLFCPEGEYLKGLLLRMG